MKIEFKTEHNEFLVLITQDIRTDMTHKFMCSYTMHVVSTLFLEKKFSYISKRS